MAHEIEIRFILQEQEEPISLELEREESVLAWNITIRRDIEPRIGVTITDNDVYSFFNSMIAQYNLLDLGAFKQIIILEDDKENIIDGEDINSIFITNTGERNFVEINLNTLKDYPSLVGVNNNEYEPGEE